MSTFYKTQISSPRPVGAIHALFGKDALSKKTFLRYFALYRKGATKLDNQPRLVQPQSKKRQNYLALVRSQSSIFLRKVCQEIEVAKNRVPRTLTVGKFNA